MNKPVFMFGTILCVGTLLMGCGGSSTTDGPITTNHDEDFDHDHKHSHSGADSHEHDHKDNFTGTHSHGHSHSHRHGEPLHGGRIVSIGHTHHKDGATHFHAEVMPLEDNLIRMHILTELDDGTSKDFPIGDKTISALISIKGNESAAKPMDFSAIGENETAEFGLKIPESLVSGDVFTVVIPKVKLGGHRQNFSFNVERKSADKPKGEDVSGEGDADSESDKKQESSE